MRKNGNFDCQVCGSDDTQYWVPSGEGECCACYSEYIYAPARWIIWHEASHTSLADEQRAERRAMGIT